MLKIIGVLLVVWLLISLLGLVLEGLFWLTILGVALFLITCVWGWFQRRGASAQ